MTNFQIGLALFAGMLTLMAFRVPIAVAMFVPGAIGYITMSGFPAWLIQLTNAGPTGMNFTIFFGADMMNAALAMTRVPAILAQMVVETGMIFLPVGLTVYIMHGLAKDVPMAETYRGVVPILISDAVRIALLISFPSLT